MAGPWEKYGGTKSEGPWTKYAQEEVPAESSGVGDFIKNAYGGYWEPALNLGTSMVATPVAGLAGIGAGLAGGDAADTVRRVQSAMTYQPRTSAGRIGAETISYPFEKLAQAADYVGNVVNRPEAPDSRISGMAANYGLEPIRTAETGVIPGRAAAAAATNTVVQALPALFGRGGARLAGDVARSPALGRGMAAGERPTAPFATTAQRPSGLASLPEAPTKAALREAADAAYKQAEESGVVVTPDSFSNLKTKISSEMQRDGIDATLHPDSTAALRRIMESEGSLTLQQLETLRRIANDAEGSIKPADRRLAGKMVDEIDDYVASLSEKDLIAGDAVKAGALKDARNFYSRAKKAEELDKLVERAELSAPNFSASGMENALRTEFRALAKNERRMRRFTKEEQEAIKRVAKGGPVENALRMLGKFAPTGVVSTALSSGLGFLAGGPAGAAALPAVGAASRYGASRMTMRNADIANALVRRGPTQAQPGFPTPEQMRRVLKIE